MKLFQIAESVSKTNTRHIMLERATDVQSYATGYGIPISLDVASSVRSVVLFWLHDQAHGNGDLERMRSDAETKLETYMNKHTGYVATRVMWKDDFDRMDVESWFGLPAEACEHKHWLDDSTALVEVEWSVAMHDWAEV